MEPAFKNFFVCAFALSLAGTAFAEDGPKKSEDALETARRDLQALPTVEGNVLPGERIPDANLPVPTFTPLTTSSGRNAAEENPQIRPSEGWLLDALKKNDDLKAQQKDRELAKLSKTDSNAQRRLETVSPDPFRTYLNSWLSPQDKRLLIGDKGGQRAIEKEHLRNDQSLRPQFEKDTPSNVGETPRLTLGLNGPRTNPYLSTPEAEQPLLPEPPTTLPKPSNSSVGNSSLLPLKEATYPKYRDSTPTMEIRKPDEPLPVPTAPLIDERRYFPQLRRF